MTKTTKSMLRTAPLGIVASAILFAGCMAPAGALKSLDVADRSRDANVIAVPVKGVADNNMTDAARAAVYGPQSFKGVADNNMSDAARKATSGRVTDTYVRHTAAPRRTYFDHLGGH